MTIMDENFLSRIGSEYRITGYLPLRLQKRELLQQLGFPYNPALKACRASLNRVVECHFNEFGSNGYPFLVIVSECYPKTLIPPLFIVNDGDEIIWRDDLGVRRQVSRREALAEINRYERGTWLEFSPYIWGPNVIAGRVLYEGADKQILEIQVGTIPSRVMDDRTLPAYSGSLSFLDLERYDYLETRKQLEEAGCGLVLPFSYVRFVCRKFQPHFTGFEQLRAIAQRPTLEFALTEFGTLTAVDIDWPSQWVQKGD